ncbi:MAG: aminopeptidase P family protein [Bacteroidota bacterium]
MSTIPNQLAALRAEMEKYQLDAYLIPSSDPHQSEYVAPHWEVRPWLSGFTGSAGTLVVTPTFAGLWTDSRYFLQAEQELAGTGIDLMKQQIPHAPEHIDWLANSIPAGGKMGFDGKVVSYAQARSLRNKLLSKGVEIVAEYDLPAVIWTKDRPALPQTPVYELEEKFSGESRGNKIAKVREWLKTQNADSILLVALDEIAWTLNIRASDVNFNPVCISYLWISLDQAIWFVEASRIEPKLQARLATADIQLADYGAISSHLSDLPVDHSFAFDSATLSYQHHQLVQDKKTVNRTSPIVALKTIKNETEIAHVRHAMRKDGAALLRLFHWLDETLKARSVSEVELAEKLSSFRAEQQYYKGDSFPAIVGYKGNGAIIHYRAEPSSCAMIKAEGVLLLDSGGQYLDGTTDITRTVALGPSTIEQRRHFTLVLKGMIALSRARFPKGTGGAQLDTLARQFLWQDGLNYGHGTGHGVGFFLNVHEGPQGFATSAVTSRGRTPFEAGMLTSNEPGFYRTDHYGIRIENLILCVEDQSTDYGEFLRFETLTLFPIDRKMIQLDLLSETETQWLNDYHKQVMDGILPLLTDEEEREWLRFQCRPL